MQNTIKITSITYIKNGKDYIEQCLTSIMNQTLKEIEIIVVDGGSTDGTAELIESFQKEDMRIKVLHKEGSVGAQFNAALSLAQGEYIAVCEGDDYILPDKYEKQYKIAKEHNLDVLRACYYRFFMYHGKEYRYIVNVAPGRKYYNRLIELAENDDIFLSLGVNGFWNGLYARDFLVTHNITMNETKGAAYQDISFSFLCQMSAKRIWFMEEALHCYRIDNPGASVNSSHCIEINANEYALLRERLIQTGKWEKYQCMYLVWEIGSYKHYLGEMNNDLQPDLLKKIYDTLRKQNIKYCFENIRMPEKSRRIIESLYADEELFSRLMTDNIKENIRTLHFFEHTNSKTGPVTLFGIGHLGSIVFDYLKLADIEFGIVDNSAEKQKEGFKGEKVYTPEEYVTANDNPIIIANIEHSGEIREQLQKLGVSGDCIVVCNNEDFFLRKIFVRLCDKKLAYP